MAAAEISVSIYSERNTACEEQDGDLWPSCSAVHGQQNGTWKK